MKHTTNLEFDQFEIQKARLDWIKIPSYLIMVVCFILLRGNCTLHSGPFGFDMGRVVSAILSDASALH